MKTLILLIALASLSGCALRQSPPTPAPKVYNLRGGYIGAADEYALRVYVLPVKGEK